VGLVDRGRWMRYLLVAFLGTLPTLGVITAEWRLGIGIETPLNLALMLVSISYPLWLPPLGVSDASRFLPFLAIVSITLGVVSFLTGAANGLTDEAYTTPLYVSLLLRGHNLYALPLVVTYTQYGVRVTVSTYYAYLPLLTFLQLPFLDYKLFSAFCWLGIVWLVRKDVHSATALAQPFVAVLAFNGFNDFAPLLLLTLAFVGWGGRRWRWSELVALGTKQFASVFVFAYHLLRRDWWNAFAAAAVTAAFLLPFLVWDWNATVCQAVLYGLPAGCPGMGHILLFHIDYGLWPLWVVAIFYAPLLTYLRSNPVHRLRTWVHGARRRVVGPPR
jgi:hypothetical protein